MTEIESTEKQLQIWFEENTKNGSISWSYIAKRTKYTSSYIRRVAKGERNPSFEFEKDVLAVICKDNIPSVYNYLVKKYPGKAGILEAFFAGKDGDFRFAGSEYDSIISDPITYRIYRLSDTGKFTPDQIQKITYSMDSGSRIEYLNSVGVTELNSGVLQRSPLHKQNLFNQVDKVISCFKQNLDIIQQKHNRAVYEEGTDFNSAHNKMFGLNESVDVETLEKLLQNVVDFLNSQRKELTSSPSKGEIPMFLNITLGRYDDK